MLKPVLGPRLISTPNTPPKPCNPIYWFLSGATAGGAITFIACTRSALGYRLCR